MVSVKNFKMVKLSIYITPSNFFIPLCAKKNQGDEKLNCPNCWAANYKQCYNQKFSRFEDCKKTLLK